MLSFKRWLERVLLVLMAMMLITMVCLMLWQVAARYLLGVPALYTEETLRFLMIWMALIGAAYCFGDNKHLSLDLIPSLLPEKVGRILYLINALVVLAFAGLVLLWGGWNASMSALNQMSPIMQVPMGYAYLILPISAILIFVLQLINVFLIMTGRLRLPYAKSSAEES
ncbi:TRAP transporter small permease [Halomonas salipaludis]|uniref:TRAP transporter small permease protein n=1 Tax=Halomonas salipaludis TaxID=2032625 RepID=A0A2A2EXN3_9GAMM|nr:TRAP transporter small permease [Halomonas salipaludis]PAU78161.1 C4-dicarboxylate ABC transporter permease [Halomonas salipaludis]